MSRTDDLHETVEPVETAVSHFITGDPAPYKACWSRADDVTIMGGWGAYEKSWEQVGPRLDWAAGRFRGGQTTYEALAMGLSGDLAMRSASNEARRVWPGVRNSVRWHCGSRTSFAVKRVPGRSSTGTPTTSSKRSRPRRSSNKRARQRSDLCHPMPGAPVSPSWLPGAPASPDFR